jgi:hypothetical protein
MKKLLILLFSLFLLSSPSVFADDISDFEIEGISIGDSLLDYMTEDEILKKIEYRINNNPYYYLKEPIKFIEIYLYENIKTYDQMAVFIKHNSNQFITNKNEKYTILSIRGIISYEEDNDSCIVKRDEIVEILSTIFPNLDKSEFIFDHPIDPSGNSKQSMIQFTLDSGANIHALCTNFEETFRLKNKYTEGLTVSIHLEEIFKWLNDHK